MKSRRRKEKEETRVQFKEFLSMDKRLHEMLRSLGEGTFWSQIEEVADGTIKLDEFEKLRQEFVRRAQEL